MLLLCALVAGSSSVWAESTDSYTASNSDKPTAKNGTTTGSVTGTNSISWSYSVTQETKANKSPFVQYSDDYGWQLGSSNSPCKAFSISTSGISGTITQIQVVTGSASASSKINVTVGGDDFGTQNQATGSGSTVSTQTFTGSASGEIIVSATASSAAFYFKSVTVTYTPSGGGGDSDPSITLGTNTVNAPETAVSTTSIEVTYNNLTDYVADVNFYESDGTTDATYDHSWLTAEINSTTLNLDYSIEANTGAERTAYLKVYAIGNEGEAESSLITITQAAKSVVAPTFNPEGGSYMQGTNITITSEGNTIYYNLTTDGSTPSNPTNASTEYTAPIVLGSGTTKIKAIAYDTYGNASSVVTRTYTGIALASLPFSWTGTKTAGKDELANETGVTVSLGSNYADSNAPYRLKFDGVGKNVTIYFNEKPESVYFTAKLFNAASTGSKIKVQGSNDGLSFTDIEEFTISGAANATFEFTTSNAFASTHRAVKLVMSSKDQNVAVGTICVSCIPIKPAKTYTTLTSAYPLDFTSVEGLKAFIVEDDNASDGKITMTQVNKVPAGTGLVLKATTPGTAVNVPVFDGTGADDVTNNKMVGSATEATEIAANAGYILKDGKFHPATAGTLAAGKAYLKIAVANGNAPLAIDFDETTGVKSIEHGTLNIEHFYDLQGRKVAQPTKGLYIVNGRKVVVK